MERSRYFRMGRKLFSIIGKDSSECDTFLSKPFHSFPKKACERFYLLVGEKFRKYKSRSIVYEGRQILLFLGVGAFDIPCFKDIYVSQFSGEVFFVAKYSLQTFFLNKYPLLNSIHLWYISCKCPIIFSCTCMDREISCESSRYDFMDRVHVSTVVLCKLWIYELLRSPCRTILLLVFETFLPILSRNLLSHERSKFRTLVHSFGGK